MAQLDKFLGHARVPAKAESVSHNLINWVMPGVNRVQTSGYPVHCFDTIH